MRLTYMYIHVQPDKHRENSLALTSNLRYMVSQLSLHGLVIGYHFKGTGHLWYCQRLVFSLGIPQHLMH